MDFCGGRSTYYNSTGHISDPIAHNYPSPTAREVGGEALGRAISYFCEGDINTCSGEGQYQFLSGYEPWLEKPLRLPERVDGVEIKDPIDLAAMLPEGVGRKIFRDLCKRRKIKL
ncbi:MAG: hypothetical protein IBX69_17480 [Anaerolineales bacterium]|nr:hypothetical protein [Anaerolineales bacterium]